MNTDIIIRDYLPTDAEAVNEVALSAFQQYSTMYDQWDVLSRSISAMSSLTESAEIIVAESASQICGAVGYVAPGKTKVEFIPREWAYLRLLVVDPNYRGKGIGSSLAKECVQRALRDSVSTIGLHTSPIMDVALGMYIRMGFEEVRGIPKIHGVPYSIYKLSLNECGI